MSHDSNRKRLIDQLQSEGSLTDMRVAQAMLELKRHLFVPAEFSDRAYVDSPLHIGFEQTISAPHMVAIMSGLLDAKDDSVILEVGTGSGYQAAILASLAPRGKVVSMERIGELFERATRLLIDELGYKNIILINEDGTRGFPQMAPYDRILVTAGAPSTPQGLVGQLAAGGRMLVPVGDRSGQTLVEVLKDEDGNISTRTHGSVIFVPLVGRDGW